MPLRSFLVLLLLAGLARGAPAPLTKTDRPVLVRQLGREHLVGIWALSWAGHPYTLTLSPDGEAITTSSSGRWHGWWAVGRDGVLYVSDAQCREGGVRVEDYRPWVAVFRRERGGLWDVQGLAGKASYCGSEVEVQLRRAR